MIDEREQLEREVEIANDTRLLVSNPVFKAAMAVRKAQVFTDFTSSKADEIERRNEAWRTMQNLLALEAYFTNALQSGKLAELSLNGI
jgi:hypothetical protein